MKTILFIILNIGALIFNHSQSFAHDVDQELSCSGVNSPWIETSASSSERRVFRSFKDKSLLIGSESGISLIPENGPAVSIDGRFESDARFLLYKNTVIELTASSELWLLDIEARAWTQAPGQFAVDAKAEIFGSKLFEYLTNGEIHAFDLETHQWSQIQ